MADKSIIIIGAGISGLCTGIYGQMNGYQTRIFEQHNIPGGLVTGWKRKGYLVDACVHWLVGSGPGFHLHRYWNEVGLLENRKFVYPDRYMVFHGRDGRTFNMYCDPDRLEKHMLDLSPQDAPAIREFIEGMRFGIRFKPPQVEGYELGPLGGIKILASMWPHLRDLQKWSKITLKELAAHFQDPLLRSAITEMWFPDFAALFMFATLGYLHTKQAGYPLGGSLPIALFLERRYKQLGGQPRYRAPVEKIIVENNRAVGVRLADGSEQRADVVVSAADGYATIFKMLGGEYLDENIRRRYRDWKTFPPLIYVSVGVNRTFPEVPSSVSGDLFELKQPVTIAGKERQTISVRVHSHDLHFAPAGKTVLTCAIETDYAYWKPMLAEPSNYDAEKHQIGQIFVAALEQVWPGISQQVEMCDVATPLTYERITGNWKASFEGWLLTPEQGTAHIPKTLPGLENFRMVGQWVYPGGGLPSGIATGREVIWRQCQKDGRTFRVKSEVEAEVRRPQAPPALRRTPAGVVKP